ncbi:ankyrin repeat domain-containing protein [Streptomyces sp. NPDC048473]|uniref:ankyrin repeat domain-containing protein n=1 Tax=unclassified Streptomyces TaxID=2593676 RepID=UPI0037246AD2
MTPVRRSTILFTALAGVLAVTTACATQSGSDSSAQQRSTLAKGGTPSPAKSPAHSPSTAHSPAEPATGPDLLEAARSGDTDAVREALRRGADVETRDENRRTPLLLAVTGNHVKAAETLIKAGADPDALDQQHDTPWLVTGVTGSATMARTLAAAHPDYTVVNRYGGTSLIPASERGHAEYVREVTNNPEIDIDINHVNNLGWTALLEAVILGNGGQDHQEVVKLLLDAGADRSITDRNGVSPLQHARRHGYTEIARLLRR